MKMAKRKTAQNLLRTSPIPRCSQIKYLVVCCEGLAWPSKHSDQLGRASTVVTNRNNIAQRTPFVFPDGSKDINEIVCSAAARKDDYSLGLGVASHCCRCPEEEQRFERQNDVGL